MAYREPQPLGGIVAERPRKRSLWIGLGLLLIGLIVIGVVFYLGDTSAPAAERVYFALGLTGMAFLSLAGQVLGVLGLVFLWHWWRGERRR
ncbi:MAG: hypothetical protein JSR98_09445 [Proteobacteria bacterium]|nr:hypothetical protein [Pseudomonadota bacterium]